MTPLSLACLDPKSGHLKRYTRGKGNSAVLDEHVIIGDWDRVLNGEEAIDPEQIEVFRIAVKPTAPSTTPPDVAA